MVEETKYRLRIPYLDCIIKVCEVLNIDVLDGAKLITKQLKVKIEQEADELKLFKKVKFL